MDFKAKGTEGKEEGMGREDSARKRERGDIQVPALEDSRPTGGGLRVPARGPEVGKKKA